MLLRIVLAILTVVLLGMVYAGSKLYQTHGQIDAINPELPSAKIIRESIADEDLPVSLIAYNTATQNVPLSSVLEGADGEEFFDMAFPVFVVTWANGRQFVIDAGLSALTAGPFGESSELLGAGPMQFHAGLGDLVEAKEISGIGFTHLHSDHVDGAGDLCESGKNLIIVQSVQQYTTTNYLTEAGNLQLEAMECAQRLLIRDEKSALKPIGGFPGVFLVNAGGHTPGSQVFVVHVRNNSGAMTYVLAGDLVNHYRAIEENISKPAFYSYLIVPENLSQLEQARVWLKGLAAQRKFKILVSHHKENISDLFPE